MNKIFYGDALNLIDDLYDESVKLVITSPPYADTLSYGDNVINKSLYEYADWFAILGKKIKRVLKSDGSFILNINDRVNNKERSLYVFETVIKLCQVSGLQLYDTYIWAKKSGLPTGGKKRLNDKFEYIFHFVKNKNKFKCNMDLVREPYADSTKNRVNTPVGVNDTVDKNGKVISKLRKIELNPLGKIPTNVFDFPTAGTIRSQSAKHPAAFHPDLPRWFIKWLTDENDTILDPFMGSGTVAEVCIEMGRQYIGFELNEEYRDLIENRLKKNRNPE